jgi:hypothetical protein
MMIGDCGFSDRRLRIEIADCGLRLPILDWSRTIDNQQSSISNRQSQIVNRQSQSSIDNQKIGNRHSAIRSKE